MRNIRKAVHAGYCWGVERAIDMVHQTTETHHERSGTNAGADHSQPPSGSVPSRQRCEYDRFT